MQALGHLIALVDHTLAHVFLQCRRDTERHITESTPVHVFAQSTVRLHVACQLGALGARIRAQLAFVRFLARVAASVHRQIGAIFENLATKLARIVALILLLHQRVRHHLTLGAV